MVYIGRGHRGCLYRSLCRMLTHDDYEFLLRVVDAILERPDEIRVRQIRADIPVVERVSKELDELGFVREGGKYILRDTVSVEELRRRRTEIQVLADMTLDPEKISLSQIAEVLQRNGTLPGIDNTINDEPCNDKVELGNGCERPRKPWEN